MVRLPTIKCSLLLIECFLFAFYFVKSPLGDPFSYNWGVSTSHLYVPRTHDTVNIWITASTDKDNFFTTSRRVTKRDKILKILDSNIEKKDLR